MLVMGNETNVIAVDGDDGAIFRVRDYRCCAIAIKSILSGLFTPRACLCGRTMRPA